MYEDKIEISSINVNDRDGNNYNYDGKGSPLFPGVNENGEPAGFEFLSMCRIVKKGSRTIGGTYIYSYTIYIPRDLDPLKLPAKDALVRLNSHDGTIKNREVTVADAWSTKFNYVIKT